LTLICLDLVLSGPFQNQASQRPSNDGLDGRCAAYSDRSNLDRSIFHLD
jgi:hypothetical protein